MAPDLFDVQRDRIGEENENQAERRHDLKEERSQSHIEQIEPARSQGLPQSQKGGHLRESASLNEPGEERGGDADRSHQSQHPR